MRDLKITHLFFYTSLVELDNLTVVEKKPTDLKDEINHNCYKSTDAQTPVWLWF